MPTTYTSKYATGAAVDAALDKAMSAVQPTDVLPVFIKVKNVSGGSLAAGTPVYPNGTVGAGDVAEVVLARADNAALSPAAAILNTTLANNASGTATVIGQMTGIDTSGLNLGNVYLAPTGGLTNTAPTNATHIVQWLGTVERKNASTGIVYANVTGPMAPIQDTPADGVTTAPVSSNWAFDHAALTTAHGISSFGASLVDDASAGDARTTLGAAASADLGTESDNRVLYDEELTRAVTYATDLAGQAARSLPLKQNLAANLTAVAALAVTDNNFIVGNGSTFVAESGATARTSLGLGDSATKNVGTTAGTVAAGDTLATETDNRVLYDEELTRAVTYATDLAGQAARTLSGSVPAAAPASASAPGVAGQLRFADGFLYVCVANSTWQRVAIATWS